MADSTTEIDLDSVIDRLLEGELSCCIHIILGLAGIQSTHLEWLGVARDGWACPIMTCLLRKEWQTTCSGQGAALEMDYRQASGLFCLSIVDFLPWAAIILLDRNSFFLPLVRGNRPGKPVQLQEYEIKYLCTKAREIFINQPILLELEAPIKICG